MVNGSFELNSTSLIYICASAEANGLLLKMQRKLNRIGGLSFRIRISENNHQIIIPSNFLLKEMWFISSDPSRCKQYRNLENKLCLNNNNNKIHVNMLLVLSFLIFVNTSWLPRPVCLHIYFRLASSLGGRFFKAQQKICNNFESVFAVEFGADSNNFSVISF